MSAQFSVLMAVYSGEKPEYFWHALFSIASQTVKADEVVIIADGELTPELYEVMEDFETLPIVHREYSGTGRLGGALSMGIEVCSYEIVARLDSDDIAVSNRFEVQLARMLSHDLDVIGCAVGEFSEDPKDIHSVRETPKRPSKRQTTLRNPFNHTSVMYRKSSVLAAGNYRTCLFFEDWDLWLRLQQHGAVFENSSAVLVYQRTNTDFYSRRSGPNYSKIETATLRNWHKEGLIDGISLLLGGLMRKIIRSIPQKSIKFVYNKILRKNI
ncbi:glycosyltransferase [Planktomarina temperata]|nr:glycosyltransferase [Planktomarina temperata]